MPRRNLVLYALLILAAVTIPALFGQTSLTQAGLFESPVPGRSYMPIVLNDAFSSPLPTPTTYLYLPLVTRGG
jgi:hypothetical protein